MYTRLITGLFAGSLILAACSGDDTPDAATSGAAENAPAVDDVAANELAASTARIDLGEIIVDADGLTLYGFTNDVDATSTCYDACADAWPPLIVNGDVNGPDDLDETVFSTVERDDGTTQLVAGTWPLYHFAGDAAPGDINGQGSGDVWFLVDPAGGLVRGDDAAESGDDEAASAPVVTTAATDVGDILVDVGGLSLYGFTNDMGGTPSCADACADAWPPALVDGAQLPTGLDGDVFSVVERPDGTFQLAAGVWPLYRFAGDAAPGDINGQGSGDVWYLAAPDGGLVRGDTPPSDDAAPQGSRAYGY